MRVTFTRCLADLADADERIVLLTGDLGFKALDDFIERHPKRFFNAGVAEQNMVGMATGLAEAGFLPFVYSIVPFAVMRPYEFIRNGPVLHQLPVRIIGVGAGMEYGNNGLTHYGLEDLAVTRVQPGMTVLAPADAAQAKQVLLATWNMEGPIYYRLGKDDRATVPGLEGRFEWDRVTMVVPGTDALLLTTSSIATEAVQTAALLESAGVSAALGVMAQINPPPRAHLLELLANYPVVAAIENHYRDGGLGSVLAEIIAEERLGCRLIRAGLRYTPEGRSGSTRFLHQAYGVSPTGVALEVRSALGRST